MMALDLKLPQIDAIFSPPRVSRRLFLVAGGRVPDGDWLRKAYRKEDLLWAVDRGLEICLEAGLVPDRVIGDFDSVSKGVLERAIQLGVPVDRFPAEKDLTDLQLALKTAGEEHGPLKVLVSGCWGGRFDHNFSNLYSLVWAREWNLDVVSMADEREVLFFLEGPGELALTVEASPHALSLLALSPVCRGVSVSGVRWELQQEDLFLERPFAVSNRLMSGKRNCRVSLEEGTLGVYLNWTEKEEPGKA